MRVCPSKCVRGGSRKEMFVNTRLLKIPEVAEHLGVAAVTVRLWIAQRRLGHVKLGRAVRVRFDEVIRLVDAGTTPALEAK